MRERFLQGGGERENRCREDTIGSEGKGGISWNFKERRGGGGSPWI